MSLFGPRRTGKTEFLLHDLGHHAAAQYGHRVLYASFWQTSVAPLGLLIYAVSEALRPRSYADRVADWLRHPPIKVRIGSEKGPGAVELICPTAARRNWARICCCSTTCWGNWPAPTNRRSCCSMKCRNWPRPPAGQRSWRACARRSTAAATEPQDRVHRIVPDRAEPHLFHPRRTALPVRSPSDRRRSAPIS